MNRDMKMNSIFPTTLISVLAILAALYFWQSSITSQQALETERCQLEHSATMVQYYEQLAQADSLIFAGRFEEANQLYAQLESSGIFEQELVRMRQNYAHRQYKLQLELDTLRTQGTENLNSGITAIQAPPPALLKARSFEQIQPDQYDSLTFALQKANLRIQMLERKIDRKSKASSYLTFKSGKGNQVYYVGDVRSEKANGEGMAILSTGSRYQGQWLNNRKHGKGIFYWSDGAYYEGEYHKDKRSGKGTYHFPNGEVFIGDWKNDVRHGSGIMYDKKGNIVVKGRWRNDEFVEGKNK